ncbi:MAG: hypothetical protein WKF86_01300 [Acidimicrobiales bacterium]
MAKGKLNRWASSSQARRVILLIPLVLVADLLLVLALGLLPLNSIAGLRCEPLLRGGEPQLDPDLSPRIRVVADKQCADEAAGRRVALVVVGALGLLVGIGAVLAPADRLEGALVQPQEDEEDQKDDEEIQPAREGWRRFVPGRAPAETSTEEQRPELEAPHVAGELGTGQGEPVTEEVATQEVATQEPVTQEMAATPATVPVKTSKKLVKDPARAANAKKTKATKKKTPAKKTPAKKTPAKKTVAKKTVAKKTVAKKAVAKKAVAKKTAVAKPTRATKAVKVSKAAKTVKTAGPPAKVGTRRTARPRPLVTTRSRTPREPWPVAAGSEPEAAGEE